MWGSVSSLQAQILTLQSESQNLRTEIAVMRAGSDEQHGNMDSATKRQRKGKGLETESRIMEVEMRLKRQLSLTELGNLAKLAETELINSRLTSKISELEIALRHANDATAHAEARLEDSEKRMAQIKAQLFAGDQKVDEKLREVLTDDRELTLREKILDLETTVDLLTREKHAMQVKISFQFSYHS